MHPHEDLAMKIVLTIIGVIAIALGLLWLGQGTGVVRWPASSFMLADTSWALRGAALVVAGLALILWARRRPR